MYKTCKSKTSSTS